MRCCGRSSAASFGWKRRSSWSAPAVRKSWSAARSVSRRTPDFFETHTADEDAEEAGGGESHEAFEERALGGIVAPTLAQLREEGLAVEALLAQARSLVDDGEDSKFEKLRGVLRSADFAREKFIVFTEHRDTAEFLVRRLEGLGFTGQVALIHGGLDYREREAQVDLFRRPLDAGGANYLVATDAAGEGINLQFCWLMVNYDVPWNPARLEQRMGRIHRYGQQHDPVVIVNLVAGETREGRVLKTLLDKLELIRKELQSDKVFDVVGRLFENVSLKDYLEQAATEEGATAAVKGIDGLLTAAQVRALGEREQARFGGGDVQSSLPALQAAIDREQFRRLLPGYVRRFITAAAPLIDLRVDGDPDGVFGLAQERRRGLDPVLAAMEIYPAGAHGCFTVYRPADRSDVIWLHPGEPVFDRFCAALLARHEDEARRGAFFVDPHARAPYLFHLARVSVVRRPGPIASAGREVTPASGQTDEEGRVEIIESRLIGLRQDGDGVIEPCPLEHLLLLRGAPNVPPGSVPLARMAHGLTAAAREWVDGDALARLVDEHRARIERSLPRAARLDRTRLRSPDGRADSQAAARRPEGARRRCGGGGGAREDQGRATPSRGRQGPPPAAGADGAVLRCRRRMRDRRPRAGAPDGRHGGTAAARYAGRGDRHADGPGARRSVRRRGS